MHGRFVVCLHRAEELLMWEWLRRKGRGRGGVGRDRAEISFMGNAQRRKGRGKGHSRKILSRLDLELLSTSSAPVMCSLVSFCGTKQAGCRALDAMSGDLLDRF